MKVAVLAEQNFNLIDGSTIWLLNVCKLLALQPDLETTLLLSHPLTDRILADELPETIRVVSGDELAITANLPEDQLSPGTVVAALSSREAQHGAFDRIFVRGTDYLTRLLNEDDICRRVVAYAPSAIPDLAQPEPEWVGLARGVRAPLVVQSDTAKHAMEALYDYPAHVVHVVPPIVFATEKPDRPDDGVVRLCYSGKVDLHYGLDWLIDICNAVADDPDLGVGIIAGKDTYRSKFRDFFKVMDGFRASVAGGLLPGVALVTGVPHAEAKARMGQADFAYCLRHSRYDDVIEISTKIVEFCTLGVPPILNDNALNRSLFGDDYPYFVDIETQDPVERVPEILRSRDTVVYDLALERINRVAKRFSAEALSERLGQAIRGYPLVVQSVADAPRRILIATHERKFLRQFLDRLKGEKQVHITWETWSSTIKPAQRPFVPPDVDTVFCEWCCENAVWHSNNKREGTRLIIRLHRFEAFRDFPARVNWNNVDALIVVSDYFRDLAVGEFGADPDRVHVMPQYIDWHGLNRSKLPEARFTLGLVGINPFEHKRFDRAVDFFAALRARDDRFALAVRSVMPWQISWVWNNREDMQAEFTTVFDRIFSDPLLKDAIRFDPAGPDMEEWYRGIGTILSSSDSEGCHTSVIEGMASGCLPVVHDWPGARSLFDPHVYSDMTDAIGAVIAFADHPDLDRARQDFTDRVEPHDVENFVQAFMKL